MDKNVRLRLVRGDTEFEAEGDREFIQEMLKRFGSVFANDTGVAPLDSSQTNGGTINGAKSLSVREFVQKLGYKKHTDICLAFAYYLEKHSDKAEFTPADINNCYYDAKLEASNTSQAIILNIKRGYIMEAKKPKGKKSLKKAYTLTHSGEAFIEKQLNLKK